MKAMIKKEMRLSGTLLLIWMGIVLLLCGFTLLETATTQLAIDNALEYFKECLENKDGLYDRDTLDQIKSSSVRCRNLQAKFRKFLNRFE